MLTALWLVTSAASLSGNLADDAPRSARLLAQAELPAPTVNRAALEAERTKLLDARPSLGLPITLMSIGAGSTLFFALLTAAVSQDAYYYGNSVDGGVLAVLGILITASIGTIALGVVSLIFRMQDRKASEPRLRAIEQQLEKAPKVPDNDEPPPPGPPPPAPPIPDAPPGPPPPPPPVLGMR